MSNALALPARTARLATPADLVSLLESQHRAKLDLVTPLSGVRYQDGNVSLSGLDLMIDETGVTDPNGLYLPTQNAETQLGALLGIPTRYLAKMRHGQKTTQADVTEGSSLKALDMNVNGWAHRAPASKNVLIRAMVGSGIDGAAGYVRAILSDRYGVRDNFDTALAVLDGMRAAGLSASHFQGAEITDNRMWIRIAAPEIYVNAPELLAGYRNPADGTASAAVGDVVFAGVEVSNSETGGGRVKVTPRLTVLACTNGMVVNKDTFGQVHLGAQMDEGKIEWSADTRTAAQELTKRQVRDAIGQFMTRDYLASTIAGLTETAARPVIDVTKAIEVVGKKLAYSDTERADILAAFIQGGQLTAGGIMQAVTYVAQGIDDVERSHEFGATGIEAMKLVAAIR